MITAKFKTWGVLTIILGVLLCLFIIVIVYVLISVYFLNGQIIKRGTLKPYQSLLFVGLFILILFYVCRALILAAMIVNIDSDALTISFRNILTRQYRIYLFKDFDGYIDTLAFNYKTADEYKVIYFVKDKKVEKILTGFYYSNMEELQEAIKPIKYLGFQKNFSALARKTFLNKNII